MLNFAGNGADNTANHVKNIYRKNRAKAARREHGLGRIFGRRTNPANA